MKSIFTKLFNTKQEASKAVNNPLQDMNPLRDLSEQSQISNQSQIQAQRQELANQPKAQSQSISSSSSVLSTTGEIVIVNKEPTITKKAGYYYTKYKDQLLKLNISPCLNIERENMKVGFDKEVFDFLFNDLEMIFYKRSIIFNDNQKTLIEEIEKSKELISAYSLLQRNTNSFDDYKKEDEIIKDIDKLKLLINSIDQETDILLNKVNRLEEKIKQHKEDNFAK